MTLFPNCKINIGLRIVRKREDGYHDLETIFYPVPLCDELELTKGSDPTCAQGDSTWGLTPKIEMEGIAVDCPVEDNLIYKCYRMMREKYPQIGPVSVRFRKNIPFGAGLGGGSSDATHMAMGLNELFQLGLSREQIARDVRVLGADCPFFAYNTPCFAEGIGDILTPIDFSLAGKRLVLIKPDVHVSTKEAYAGVHVGSDPTCAQGDSTWGLTPSVAGDAWVGFTNDFETSVFAAHPELAAIKKRLLDAGAVYAAMSGSGSTIFGLFEEDAEGGSHPGLRLLEQEMAPMIIFNDTLR